MLTRATLLRSNGSQAVRLPKAIAFPETVREVVIVPDGPRRIIAPVGVGWDDFFDALGTELASRDQPAMQERKRF
jgi:antitoxin VapB